MKKVLLVSVAALAVACGDSKDDDNNNNAQAKCQAAEVNLKSCSGNLLRTCVQSGADYVYETTDCAATSKVCTPGTTQGTASCTTAGGGNTYTGFTSVSTEVFWDDDLIGRHTIASMDNAVAASATAQIIIENWVGYEGYMTPGTNSTVQITGANTSYEECGTCLIGVHVDAASQGRLFFASSGTVSGTVPAAIGGATNVTLTNVLFKEVNDSFQLVTGGQTWLVPSVTITAATSSRYNCEDVPMGNPSQTLSAANTTMCAGSFTIAKCNADLKLEPDSTCADAMKKCSETSATATTCVDLPCNDASLNFTSVGYLDLRVDPTESFCWPFSDGANPVQIATCNGTAPGVVTPGTNCTTTSQVCKDSTPPGTAVCGAP